MKERRTKSKSCFILAAVFAASSVVYFVSGNTVSGTVWLSVAALELIIALILRAKEKRDL